MKEIKKCKIVLRSRINNKKRVKIQRMIRKNSLIQVFFFFFLIKIYGNETFS